MCTDFSLEPPDDTPADDTPPDQLADAPAPPAPFGTAARAMALSRRLSAPPVVTASELTRDALEMARDLVPAARWASLSSGGGTPRTTASSDPLADVLDALQYRCRSGPCLDALHGGTVVVSEFATEMRWPQFTALATASPVTAVLSYPLAPAGHPATSLNLYTDVEGAFDGSALHSAALAASSLAVMLTAISQRSRADRLRAELASTRRIGAAIGILMQRQRWSYERATEAFYRARDYGPLTVHELVERTISSAAKPR
jgi:hypothetical protein